MLRGASFSSRTTQHGLQFPLKQPQQLITPSMTLNWSALWKRDTLRPQSLPSASRWPLVVGVILGIWIGFGLYADTLSVPYLQEDVSHLIWLESQTPISPFLSAEGAPAYRPLGKMIIKIWDIILGEHNRPFLRFHNLALNALATALIGRIGVWLDPTKRRYWTGGLAAVLFGAYPFTYQAVPWINNFFYPLENFLLLMMIAVYWRAREKQSNRLLAVALFLCGLAPFEIEYGVVGGGILFALEIAWWLQKRQSGPWFVGALLGLILNIGYVIIWFTIPKSSYAFGGPTLERMYQISHYFLQGLGFPVSPLATTLMERGWLNDLRAIQLVVLPVVIIGSILLLRSRRIGLWAFALLWFVLINFPALVFVDTSYVINSPRLLYPAGAAVVWLWGGSLALLMAHRNRILPILGLIATVGIVAFHAQFVQVRMEQYKLIEDPVYQLMDAARAAEDDDTLLIVNFPEWITKMERTFALGNHGIQLNPSYIGLDAYITAHTWELQSVETVKFDTVVGAPPYFFGRKGPHVNYEELRDRLLASGNAYVVDYSETDIQLRPAGRVTQLSAMTADVTFGDLLSLSLVGVEQADGTLSAELQWQLNQPVSNDFTVFVHLYDANGQLVSQADGDLLRGLAPFGLWEAGQSLRDFRQLSVPAGGSYSLGIGVYNRLDGARLPAVDANGNPFTNDVAIIFELSREQQ